MQGIGAEHIDGREGFVGAEQLWLHSYNGEPSVNLQCFKRFLAQHQITPILNAKLASVQMNGGVIVSATFACLGTVQAKVFIDASYEGDLLAQAGCSYFIGREANACYGETHNGVRGLTQGASQFPDGVDPYVEAGDPASGVLPFVSTAALSAAGSEDTQVEAFCFRLVLTNNAPNRVAIPEPTAYDPLKYELLGRAITAGLKANAITDLLMLTELQDPRSLTRITMGRCR